MKKDLKRFYKQTIVPSLIADFGYKNNKVGFLIGTGFEFLDDLNLGLATSTYYEKIETNSTASARQKSKKEIILIHF